MNTATVELTKTAFNLPDDLRRALKQAALDDDTTMTAIIIEACWEYLGKRKTRKA